MAYLRTLDTKCDGCHKRPATVQLFSRDNAIHGKFCDGCGQARLKMLKDQEANLPRRQS